MTIFVIISIIVFLFIAITHFENERKTKVILENGGLRNSYQKFTTELEKIYSLRLFKDNGKDFSYSKEINYNQSYQGKIFIGIKLTLNDEPILYSKFIDRNGVEYNGLNISGVYFNDKESIESSIEKSIKKIKEANSVLFDLSNLSQTNINLRNTIDISTLSKSEYENSLNQAMAKKENHSAYIIAEAYQQYYPEEKERLKVIQEELMEENYQMEYGINYEFDFKINSEFEFKFYNELSSEDSKYAEILENKLGNFEGELLQELTKIENIEFAYDLALQSRLNYDPYYNNKEIELVKKDEVVNYIISLIKQGKTSSIEDMFGYSYSIPKTIKSKRYFYYMPFEIYVIQYLICHIIFKHSNQKIYHNVIGGRDELFNLSATKENKTLIAEKFISWCENKHSESNYALILDIESFFDSISIKKLNSIIAKKLGISENSFFLEILKSTLSINYYALEINKPYYLDKKINGLPTGQKCLEYLANIYLSEMDELIVSESKLQYARMTDDIRIFASNIEDINAIIPAIEIALNNLNLKLNKNKTKILKKNEKDLSDQFKYFRYNSNFMLKTTTDKLTLSDYCTYDFSTMLDRRGISESYEIAFNIYCNYILEIKPGSYDESPEFAPKNIRIIIENIYGNEKSFQLAATALIHSVYLKYVQDGKFAIQFAEEAAENILSVLDSPSICSYAKFTLLNQLLVVKNEYDYKAILKRTVHFKSELIKQLKNLRFSSEFDYLLKSQSNYILRKEGWGA